MSESLLSGSFSSRSFSSESFSSKLAVYYGAGELAALGRFERVALQPGHYRDDELEGLRAAGTAPLAYLSLGEDTGGPAPWCRDDRNPDWHGFYVRAGHPGWIAHIARQAEALTARGFAGFLLDTLDCVDLFPEDRDAYLELVRRVRAASPGGYLLANRGFALLPDLARLVDGVLFEAFSSTWQGGGTRALPPADLLTNTERLGDLESLNLDLYALDYADAPALAAFARDRAVAHGLEPLVSNRLLTRLEAV